MPSFRVLLAAETDDEIHERFIVATDAPNAVLSAAVELRDDGTVGSRIVRVHARPAGIGETAASVRD